MTATSGLIRGGVHPKFWVLFFLGGHCHELFFMPTLDFSDKCKEESWIFSTGQRHRGSPGEGCTLKFGRYFSLAGIAKSYFSAPHWIFTTSVRRGGGFFPPDSDIGAHQGRGAP